MGAETAQVGGSEIPGTGTRRGDLAVSWEADVNVLGWVGLLAGGPGWVIALVWAYTCPNVSAAPEQGQARPTGTTDDGGSE